MTGKDTLQQPSCSLVGLAGCLVQTGGDFAVVVHGPVDCANTFPRHVPLVHFGRQGAGRLSSHRFFSSNLSESDVTLGRSEQALTRCLESVVAALRPRVVFVLGTCLSDVIGDDIKKVAARAAKKTGTRVVALAAGGLHMDRQQDISDLFEGLMLAAAPRKKRKPRGSVVLAGLSLEPAEEQELGRVLDAAGLRLASVLREFSTLEDWHAAAGARFAAVMEAGAHPSMVSVLEKKHGTTCLDVPAPFGIRGTHAFYHALLEGTGRRGRAARVLGEMMKTARQAVRQARQRLEGKRVAYETGSALGFRPGQHAQEGLAHGAVFEELGMAVELLVQGPDSPGQRRTIESLLARQGRPWPYRIFQDPGMLTRTLEGRCDLAYCSDGRMEQVLAAGCAFLALGSLRPLFSGMARNAGMIESAAHSIFFKRYGSM
jgi:nitrogenase molybdenum-iron protein alpha/beta subunit